MVANEHHQSVSVKHSRPGETKILIYFTKKEASFGERTWRPAKEARRKRRAVAGPHRFRGENSPWDKKSLWKKSVWSTQSRLK